MAGHCIGELHLQGVVVGVLPQLAQAVGLVRQVGIVLHHRLVQPRLLLLRQRGRLAVESVEQQLAVAWLFVGIVHEAQRGIGKAEAVELLHIAHAQHLHDVAVGDEADGAVLVKPVVVVLHHHQVVAGIHLLLAEEYAGADALVEEVGALVAARNHHHVLQCGVLVLAVQGLLQVETGQVDHVGRGGEQGQRGLAAAYGGNLATQRCRIGQDARQALLAHNLGQLVGRYVEAESGLQVALVEGGTLALAHRRQLCRVADKHQSAVVAVVDVVYQVLQQTVARRGGFEPYHRGFVDDKQGVAVLVYGAHGAQRPRGVGGGHVDFLVDGVGRPFAVAGQHLGGAAGRGQKYGADPQLGQRLYQRRDQTGLAGAGVATQ